MKIKPTIFSVLVLLTALPTTRASSVLPVTFGGVTAPAQDGVCARAGIAGRAADDLLHFAFLQANARSKHARKL